MVLNFSNTVKVFRMFILLGVGSRFVGAGLGSFNVFLTIMNVDDKTQALISIFLHHSRGELRIQMRAFYYDSFSFINRILDGFL